MDMPKAGPEKSGRSNAILPGAAYSTQEEDAPSPEHEEDDEEKPPDTTINRVGLGNAAGLT